MRAILLCFPSLRKLPIFVAPDPYVCAIIIYMEDVPFARTLYRGFTILPLCAILLLCACGGVADAASGAGLGKSSALPAVIVDPDDIRMPSATGENVSSGAGVTVDASNTGEGYVMVASEPNEKTVVARVAADAGVYNYRQPTDNTYETYPLQMGDGAYSVQAFEQVDGDRYARVFTEAITVSLADANAPFLYPNQYVPYQATDAAVAASFSITQGLTDPAEIADKLYKYVARNISYDYDKAASVQSGYLPVPDETLATKTGICFDYSALLATMLRVQGIPAKLVIGHVAPDNIYHAWNEAYIDGKWVHYDATLAAENREQSSYQTERIY